MIVLLAGPGHGILSAFADDITGTPAPSVVSDQPDYAPGSVVTLTGANWPANDTLQISVDDNQNATWSFADTVSTNSNGTFTEYVTLPNWFVASYSVDVTDGIGNSASSSFTDAIKLKIVGTDGHQYSPPNVENLSSHISGSTLSISCPSGGLGVSATGLGSTDDVRWTLAFGAAPGDTAAAQNSTLSPATTLTPSSGDLTNGVTSCVTMSINLSTLTAGSTYNGSLVQSFAAGGSVSSATAADYYFTFTTPASVSYDDYGDRVSRQ